MWPTERCILHITIYGGNHQEYNKSHSRFRFFRSGILSMLFKVTACIFKGICTLLPHVGKTTGNNINLIAFMESSYVVSYTCLIHSKPISCLFMGLHTILPYMGISTSSTANLIAYLKSSYVASYICFLHSQAVPCISRAFSSS